MSVRLAGLAAAIALVALVSISAPAATSSTLPATLNLPRSETLPARPASKPPDRKLARDEFEPAPMPSDHRDPLDTTFRTSRYHAYWD